MATKNTYPSVLSCERKISPSDGLLYGCNWEDRDDVTKRTKLTIDEKTVRSTISNTIDLSKAESLKKIASPNLQSIDFCMLPNDEDTLVLTFTLKFFSGVTKLSACDNTEFDSQYNEWVRNVLNDGVTLKELALRYAQNIANGRFLWRNRVGADDLMVTVSHGSEKFTFKCYEYSIKDFAPQQRQDQLLSLAQLIEDTLGASEPKHLLLDIEAFAKIGKGQEIFPSQEMLIDPNADRNKKGKKSRFLYSSFGQAAIHSQKIGNAIRTIDTWYSEDGESLPIAAECYGAVTTKSIAYRYKSNDFYTLFKRALITGKELSTTEKMYVLAILLRGGVFGAKEE